MGTRGCVAIKDGNGWTGLYNHYDSYPTWLGPRVWTYLKSKGVKTFEENLKKYNRWEDMQDEEATHPERIEVTSKDPDPLFIEWVYIIDSEKRTVTVLTSVGNGKGYKRKYETWKVRRMKDGFVHYAMCAYAHAVVGTYSLDGPEPDWGEVRRRAETICDEVKSNPSRLRDYSYPIFSQSVTSLISGPYDKM